MARPDSSATRLESTIAADRERIAAGGRPCYHVTWTTSPFDGAADVRIVELPIVHLFVPGPGEVLEGARVLIARVLAVGVDAFDVTPEDDA